MEDAGRRCLALPDLVVDEIQRVAEAERPREACGILVGKAEGVSVLVTRVEEARNLEVARPWDRYKLAPEDFLAAERGASEDGLEVLGFWHSHPASPACPSPTDRETAWEGYSYLIVSLAGRDPELRSWRLIEDGFVEEEVAVTSRVLERGAAR